MERQGYALQISYGGSPFHGWARQPGLPTVQESLENALGRLGIRAPLAVAGRTDAGVHARRQVVSFRLRASLDDRAIPPQLQQLLPRAVRARELVRTDASFHARASALSREYRYRLNCPGLDLGAAEEFLKGQLGFADRAPFTTRPEGPRWTSLLCAGARRQAGNRYEFRFVADGYSRHLVRNWMAAALAFARGGYWDHRTSRGWQGPQAASKGLILWSVRYPCDPFKSEAALPAADRSW